MMAKTGRSLYPNETIAGLVSKNPDGDFHEVVQYLVEHLDVAVILIGTTNSMSRELLPYAQAIEDLDRIADAVARPAPNGANPNRFQ